jgi:hypothetical protein
MRAQAAASAPAATDDVNRRLDVAAVDELMHDIGGRESNGSQAIMTESN